MKILLGFVAVLCLSFSFAARSAISSYSNIIYFNAAGEPVGQSATDCMNKHDRGGDETAPYTLTIRGGCGNPPENCGSVNGPTCRPDADGTTDVTSSLSGHPPFTLKQACDVVAPACTNELAPVLLDEAYGFKVSQVR